LVEIWLILFRWTFECVYLDVDFRTESVIFTLILLLGDTV